MRETRSGLGTKGRAPACRNRNASRRTERRVAGRAGGSRLGLRQEQAERIHRECLKASGSDAALFAFVAKQASALESMSPQEVMAQQVLVQARYSAGMTGLEILEQRNGDRSEVLARVGRLREQLSDGLSATYAKRRRFNQGLAVGVVALVLLAVVGMVVVVAGLGKDAAVRQDVQKLIQQGRYGEARIRAQDLGGSGPVKRMMEAIDQAEKSRGLPPLDPEDGSLSPPRRRQMGGTPP